MWQGSEYAFGYNYGRVLNIPGLKVFQVSPYTNVALGPEYTWAWLNNALQQGSEYAWSTFHKLLNKLPVLNKPGLRIWQGSEYPRVTQGVEYAWISFNMP